MHTILQDDDPPVGKTRRPYSNTGPQLTPRFEAALRFIGQQGAIRFDHLQQLFGRLSPEPDALKVPGTLSEERTRKILRRWSEEDLYSYRVFYAQQRGWIWLTRKGLKYASLDLRFYEPAPSSLPHLCAVNEIRLLMAARYPKEVWRSERELRAEQDTRVAGRLVKHLPDAELLPLTGGAIAIEVACTAKSEKRFSELLLDLAGNAHYQSIWYFAPQEIQGVLIAALEKLPQKHRTRFVLSDMQGKLHHA